MSPARAEGPGRHMTTTDTSSLLTTEERTRLGLAAGTPIITRTQCYRFAGAVFEAIAVLSLDPNDHNAYVGTVLRCWRTLEARSTTRQVRGVA